MNKQIVKNTFNAFYAITWGNNAKIIDYDVLEALCKSARFADLQKLMHEVLDAFAPFFDRELNADDWEKICTVANDITSKYHYLRYVMDVVSAIVDGFERGMK